VGVTADLATDPRLRIWDEALRRIGEAPWVGRGFGRGTLRSPEGAPRDGIQDPSQWHAHNLFLNVMLSLGAVGLALFIWTWAAMARELARALRSPAPWRWGAVLGITLLAGFTLKNFTDDFFVRHVALLGWSLAGALLGMLREAPPALG
jgi:O-antigen ligase